jgi:hypothetical protein
VMVALEAAALVIASGTARRSQRAVMNATIWRG